MSKKNFVSLVFGVVGGVLFAIGMCMCMLPEWNAFNQGCVMGVIGAAVLLAMLLVRRRMSGKPMIALNLKTIGRVLFGIIGALVLGLGMCMVSVWGMMVQGIIVGIVGIVLLLALIPLCMGIKADDN